MIHTGPGVFTNPVNSISVAKKYPEVTIVLANAGFVTYTNEAVIAAQLCSNITLELSWTTSMDLKTIVNKLGSTRVMFGTDHIFNIPTELSKINSLGFDNKQKEDIYSGTAKRVFKL